MPTTVPRSKSIDRTKTLKKTAHSPEDKSSTPSPTGKISSTSEDTSATHSKSGKISTTPEVTAPSKNISSASEAKLPSPVKTPLEPRGAQQSRSLKDFHQQEDSDQSPETSHEKESALKPAPKSKASLSPGHLRPQSGSPESASDEDASARDLRADSSHPMTTHSSTLTPPMRSPQPQLSTESFVNWNFIILLFAYAALGMFIWYVFLTFLKCLHAQIPKKKGFF